MPPLKGALLRGAAALVLAFPAPAAFAQEPPRRIGLNAAVETVSAEIDVLVTDAKGRPVPGLTKSDFRLFVDGRELPVDWAEAPPPPAPAPAPAPRAVGAPPGSAPAAAAARPAHSTVLLVDDLHLDFAARYAGLRGLRELVERLPPEEEIAVYAFRLGLRRLQPFTRDRAAVLAALGRAGRTIPTSSYVTEFSTWYGWTRQELDSMAWLFSSLANRPEPKTFVVLARPIAHRMMQPEELMTRPDPVRPPRFVSGMTRLAESRDDLLGDDAGRRAAPDVSARGATFFADQSGKVADEALLARATVVAVDPSGLRPEADVESRSLDTSADPWDDAWAYKNDALAFVARETGGARLGYTNRPGDVVVREAELLEQRYRLGFTPAAKGSARRDLRVEVARAGLHVRAAAGQRTQTREASDRARFASLVLSGAEPHADFAIAVGVDHAAPAWRRAKGERPSLACEIFVPVRELLLDETPKGPVAKIEFLFAALDREGRTSDLQARPLTLRFPAGDEEAKQSLFRIPARLLKPKHGTQRFLIGVRDRVTGRLGVTTLDVKA